MDNNQPQGISGNTDILDQMLYEGRLSVDDYCRVRNTKAAAERRVLDSKFQVSNQGSSEPQFK